jgi:hypothetical protein
VSAWTSSCPHQESNPDRRSRSPSLYRLSYPGSLLGPNIILSTLFSDTLNLCSSLGVSHQVLRICEKRATLQLILFVGFQETKIWKDSEENVIRLSPNLIYPNSEYTYYLLLLYPNILILPQCRKTFINCQTR